MIFHYNGVCTKCGCGTTADGDSRFQSDYELCFGCGTRKWFQPKEDEDGLIVFSKGQPIMVKGEEQGFGTCLTKDFTLITFTKEPSKARIKELKENSLSLVLWNKDLSWLDVVVGSPLMRKDVILLENNYSVKKYVNEPEYPKHSENASVNADNVDDNIVL